MNPISGKVNSYLFDLQGNNFKYYIFTNINHCLIFVSSPLYRLCIFEMGTMIYWDFIRWYVRQEIFNLSEWNWNLNSSDCRTSKVIWNDSKLEPISWDLILNGHIFNPCVGVWVGKRRPKYSGRIWFWMKNWQKLNIIGVKIASK